MSLFSRSNQLYTHLCRVSWRRAAVSLLPQHRARVSSATTCVATQRCGTLSESASARFSSLANPWPQRNSNSTIAPIIFTHHSTSHTQQLCQISAGNVRFFQSGGARTGIKTSGGGRRNRSKPSSSGSKKSSKSSGRGKPLSRGSKSNSDGRDTVARRKRNPGKHVPSRGERDDRWRAKQEVSMDDVKDYEDNFYRMQKKRDSELRAIRQAAKRGDVEQQYSLSLMHLAGANGATLDEKLSRKWMKAAAENPEAEHVQAQYFFARMQKSGLGADAPDFNDSLRWFHKAAVAGHAGAQYHAAMMARDLGDHLGDTLELLGIHDPKQYSIDMIVKASVQEHPGSMTMMGTLHLLGEISGAEDPAAARKWFEGAVGIAAEPVAQLSLGIMMREGVAGKADPAGAVDLLESAASAGIIEAQQILAHMYTEGDGIPQDLDRGAHWDNIVKVTQEDPARAALLLQGVDDQAPTSNNGQEIDYSDEQMAALLRHVSRLA
jgi:TPR repeat protein